MRKSDNVAMHRWLAMASLGAALLTAPVWGQRGGRGGMSMGGGGHGGFASHGGGGFSRGPVYGGGPHGGANWGAGSRGWSGGHSPNGGWGWRRPPYGQIWRVLVSRMGMVRWCRLVWRQLLVSGAKL